MPIEPQAWGQIVLAVLGIISTIVAGLMGNSYLKLRNKSQQELEKQRQDADERLKQKDLELEKARQERETTEAENEKIKAEAASIVAEAKVKELNAEREKRQAEQNSALQYNWQTMLEGAFNRMAASNERDFEVKTKLVEVISEHNKTSKSLASYVDEGMKKLNDGQDAIQTTMTEFHVTLIGVEREVAPVQEMVTMLKQLVATSNALLDLAQVQAQAEAASTLTLPQPTTEILPP
jgi:hypothetical protein